MDLDYPYPRKTGNSRKSGLGMLEANGFCHLGQFSIAYKKAFGEKPSDTLKGK
jgi:hypothetical protein